MPADISGCSVWENRSVCMWMPLGVQFGKTELCERKEGVRYRQTEVCAWKDGYSPDEGV